ncbi:TonB-dependent receptor [Marichromatium bheemlicum]|uniref:TonB-dependent receptor n=2 Tax=Marichromatium bheemlicum TaxID=365339 RepID=A0ABX1I6L3_9GAMM|nr:TonB-dependent receptor [Marichromatium bheemlicum]NKN31860.1 TonB-dependent receptor [Marichromatium bheemlicum]
MGKPQCLRIDPRWGLLLLWALMSLPVCAEDLTDLSLEELLDVEVTSVGKKSQALADAAAAVFVIDAEDIRRSGATAIPELLRMVPGLQVGRLDANKWAISARGFNGRFANKLLVLIDGRTLYTPSFSGVYWEQQDLLLADIERIEVIRGPGATLWGANAVNGVVNIITRSAESTQGGLLSVAAGGEERGAAAVRYGAEIAPETFARFYAQYRERDALVTINGEAGRDGWDSGQGGFRIDARLAGGDLFTLQGDLYRNNLRQQLRIPSPEVLPERYMLVDDRLQASGANLLARWERALSVSSQVSLQLYYDHVERDEYYVAQRHDILDIDFQHRVMLGARHDLVWGVGYRHVADDFSTTRLVSLVPDADARALWNGFLQDEITLLPGRLNLTLGSKFEHNDYTGVELQPNARLLWRASPRSSLWASVSHAVRTPSRAERSAKVWARVVDSGLPPPAPASLVAATVGNDDVVSESLTAYELGWRLMPMSRLSLDLALFYNDYDELRTSGDAPVVVGADRDALYLDLPFANQGRGHSYGAELAGELQLRDWWRLAFAYGFLEIDLEVPESSRDRSNDSLARADPRQQLSLRSLMSPRQDLDLDLWLRYVDGNYPAFDIGQFSSLRIPAYWELDVRLAWRPRPGLEFALVGQNLLSPSHQEGYPEAFAALPLEVQRGVYASVRVDF